MLWFKIWNAIYHQLNNNISNTFWILRYFLTSGLWKSRLSMKAFIWVLYALILSMLIFKIFLNIISNFYKYIYNCIFIIYHRDKFLLYFKITSYFIFIFIPFLVCYQIYYLIFLIIHNVFKSSSLVIKISIDILTWFQRVILQLFYFLLSFFFYNPYYEAFVQNLYHII